MAVAAASGERLVRLAVEAYREVARLKKGSDEGVPPIEARFYPYAGMRSTIRLRDGRLLIRLSDLLEPAPDAAVGGLIRILVAKLLRRRVRREWEEAYRAFASTAEMIGAMDETKRQRGRKELAPPRGRVYDLGHLFDRLNREFFGGELERPRLGWTLRDSRRTHGHYDLAHKTIALSRTLDDPDTPVYVVEFVLYHEMLHAAMPSEVRNGRRLHHTAAFRKAEARFPLMEEAVAWLEKSCEGSGTGRRRRRVRGRG